MKAGWWILVSTGVLLALLSTEAEAGRTLRDLAAMPCSAMTVG